MPIPSESKWSIKKIRDLVKSKFKKRACLFQIKVAQALREKKDDVVAVAATGSGKTLSFWIPLLMALEDGEDKMIIVVTPLNILGKQNVDLLQVAGISSTAIDATNASAEVFQAVEAGQHRVVVANPEIILQPGGHFEALLKKPKFTSRLLYVVFDEGHCVSEWSHFRAQYKDLGRLRFIIPDTIPFYVASATLPTPILVDVMEILNLRSARTQYILRSNDRPDVHLAVRKMQYAASSYNDLNFVIPNNFTESDPPPPKFLIFFDSIKEAEAAVRHLRNRLPEALRGKIKHFHSVMSPEYRSDEYEALRGGDLFGLCVTDSFGMGLDLADIKLIVQWKIPSSMNALWQRFGRAARGDGVDGIAILLAEKQYFDDERAKKLARSAKKSAKGAKKRKAGKTFSADVPASKRQAHSNGSPGSSLPVMPLARDGDMADEVHESGSEPDESSSESESEGEQSSRGMHSLAVPSEDPVLPPLSLGHLHIPTAPNAVFAGLTRKPREERVLQPAMDDFVNAEARGLKCRRVPITLAYSNDKRAWDHIECDNTQPNGCPRCAPKVSAVCCDLCNPRLFEHLAAPPLQPVTRTMNKSHVKKHPLTSPEHDLRHAILEWRKVQARAMFQQALPMDLGNDIFMSTMVIDRIVDCAHVHKLPSIDSLKRELDWGKDLIETHGIALLEIIRRFFPIIIPPAVPTNATAGPSTLPASSLGTADGSGPRKRKAPTCGNCGQLGHTSKSMPFPQAHDIY
ncbi:P-loop containing nucleoside triphosphate hydrolase protein [Amylocystis lapponica]|nr:P-loop containing nucleoside triphosphate hydrolase protein [Amylocystis lapponica]